MINNIFSEGAASTETKSPSLTVRELLQFAINKAVKEKGIHLLIYVNSKLIKEV